MVIMRGEANRTVLSATNPDAQLMTCRQKADGEAVIAAQDRIAIGFLSACHELGIRVGRGQDCTIRLASHDDHPYSRFTCPSLTTAAHDYQAVADHSVETLFRLIEAGGQLEKREETQFAARLIMRASA